MSRVRAVLFDVDGTLVDSNELHVRAWEAAFAAHGARVAAEAIRGQIGKGADLLVPALLPGADAQAAEAIGDTHGKIFKARFRDEVQPFPRAHDLLARTKAAGRRVVLASSASREEVDHYVALLDAAAIVDASTSVDDVGTSKPAPDIFAVSLQKAGVPAAEAVAVGDSPYDVEAARACGVAAVALRSGGFDGATLMGAGAAALYADAADLLEQFARSPLG